MSLRVPRTEHGTIIGDRDWRELLWDRYQQHVADSARKGTIPLPFDTWATERTWTDFVRLGRLVMALPAFALSDWATSHPVPLAAGQYRSKILARRLISALVLVNQLLESMERPLGVAVRRYLKHERGGTGLAEAKGFVYAWLLAAAEREAVAVR